MDDDSVRYIKAAFFGYYSINFFFTKTNYLRKFKTFAYLHQHEQSPFKVIKIFNVNKKNSYGNQKKSIMASLEKGTVWFRPPYNWVYSIRILNKTNFKNNNKQTVHWFILDLPKY